MPTEMQIVAAEVRELVEAACEQIIEKEDADIVMAQIESIGSELFGADEDRFNALLPKAASILNQAVADAQLGKLVVSTPVVSETHRQRAVSGLTQLGFQVEASSGKLLISKRA